MFTPLDHPGIPLDRHARHWHELDVTPVDSEADTFTLFRIITTRGLEAQAGRLGRRLSGRSADEDTRWQLGSLGAVESMQRRVLDGLLPELGTGLAAMIAQEQAALQMVTWAAQSEGDPYRTDVYEHGAMADFDRLYRYANLFELAAHRRADRVVGDVDGVMPRSATAAGEPGGARPPGGSADLLSELHTLTVGASERQLMAYYRSAAGGPVEPIARPLAQDVAAIAWERDEQQSGAGRSWGERLVMHECAECYLYYSFLEEETDPQVRAVWELFLEMELAHLQAAGHLLRTREGRDPEEVVGTSLPEPARFGPSLGHLRRVLAHRMDPHTVGTGAARDTYDRTRWPRDGGPDNVIELLRTQHARIENLLTRASDTSGESRRATFAELGRLIAAHEIAEEELIHPLFRQVQPDGGAVVGLLDEERGISDQLADLVGRPLDSSADTALEAMRDDVLTHLRHEERTEFVDLQRALSPEQSRELAAGLRAAEEAASVRPRDSGSPGWADEPAPSSAPGRAVHDQIRDAIRTATH
ncbi:MAG: hypothetical protein JWO79_37 [Actinomycetia bacterium]|nr:hypothetical protein [Actinomycetes bacterium]